MAAERVRLAILDECNWMGEMLGDWLERQGDSFELVARVASVKGLQRALGRHKLDVVLCNMGHYQPGLQKTIEGLSGTFAPPIVVYGDNSDLSPLLDTDTHGVVGGDRCLEDLAQQIRTAASRAGHTGPESSECRRLMGLLTPREKEVFCMIAQGKTSEQIAEALGVRLKTVLTYRERIRVKTGFKSIRALLAWCCRKRRTSRATSVEKNHG